MNWQDKNANMRDAMRTLNKARPDLLKGFGELSKVSKNGQALDLKTLELIAVAIAVSQQCEPCIGFHSEALIKAGCTRQEFEDMLAMAVQMGGGPSLMYAAKALECWDDLSA